MDLNISAFAPAPSANVAIATILNIVVFLRRIRTAKRRSCRTRSNDIHPHISRLHSSSNNLFPTNLRRVEGLLRINTLFR